MYAHTPNADGEWHGLSAHLLAVAERAAGNAESFGGSALARWSGLWHDVGKASTAFQSYLAICHREPGRKHTSVDHKGVGALQAIGICDELAFLIQGHHGGLPDQSSLRTTLKERAVDPRTADARERAQTAGVIPIDWRGNEELFYPSFVQNPHSLELFLRMLFSALVDADHLDTERHFTPDKSADRGGVPDLATLAARLEAAQSVFQGAADSPVNRVRHEVYEACREAAALPPGFFRLTVPTGGGKTRSGLAFALRHALAHDLRRVIVAVPYLTITDQTADVYRQVLGDDRAVLEHHSGVGQREDPDGPPTLEAIWRRLAAQDWDAPVIVTTTVQLFESLFARSPSACRKLHRIARSVVILDEAQTLPTPLLEPILDVLRELVTNYGVSVVLCTATQPSFNKAPGFSDLRDVREIAPDPARLFRTLKRVAYEWPALVEPWDWERVAQEMRTSSQALAIVNTKADALALLDALGDPEAFHLSTLLCGAHRRDVLTIIRKRLDAGRPCRVVSTQVVEAGVDLDFPLVMRAMGPLDRIVQAAGRCNRSGRLAAGRVVIFDPADGSQPPGPYRTGTDVTRGLLARGEMDPDDPSVFTAYFDGLFGSVPLDPKGVQKLRAGLAFQRVAETFRMIDEDTASVIVAYKGLRDASVEEQNEVRNMDHGRISSELIEGLRGATTGRDPALARRLMARAQPYIVSVRQRQLERYPAGFVSELGGGLWAWEGGYDDVRGMTLDRNPDDFVV